LKSEERVSIDRVGGHAAAPDQGLGVLLVQPDEATPEAVEFVRFCYRRSGVVWPDLYDEMCAVAARGAFRGLEYEELFGYGISFSLTEMPRMAAIAQRVVTEERGSRAVAMGPMIAARG
jgi:hypothetical protein